MAPDGTALTLEGRVEAEAPDFGQIVRQHQRKVLFLALDLTGNHHDAEDLAQEAFLRAFASFQRFRGEASLGTWLYRITVNTYIDRYRARSARGGQARSWDDEDDSIAPPRDEHPARDPERVTESAAIQRHIDAALARLSPQQRTVFVLRHYQDLKLREIAAVLEVSEGTVKSVLFRAVQRLRDALAFYRQGTDGGGKP
jgi:RNA polymerase sigma-70 factor (ECF subfamily)